MDEPILTNLTEKVDVPEDLVSFDDCPNKCSKGRIFDPYKHKFNICPYCAEKRKTLVKQSVNAKETSDTLLKKLNLRPNLYGTAYDFNNIVPMSDKPNMDDGSYQNVRAVVDALMNKAVLGEDIEYSLLFNFGHKANILNFVYPLLIKYYIAGVDVAPFLTSKDVIKLRYYVSKCEDKKLYDVSYDDIVERKVCVVWLIAGYTLMDIETVKGLMEERAANNLSTIIVTTTLDSNLYRIESVEDDHCKYLATLNYIKYIPMRNALSNANEISAVNTMKRTATTRTKPMEDNVMGDMSAADFDAILGR